MAVSPILAIPQVASNQNQKEVTINDAVSRLEAATQGSLPVAFANNAATLTPAQFVSAVRFACSGQTAAATLTVPLQPRLFVVSNAGGFAVTVQGASGAAVNVNAGASAVIACDGTSCVAMAGGSGSSGNTGGGTATPAATTTWNPADKGADLALSNASLTVSGTPAGGNQLARATTNKTSGKWYLEIGVVNAAGNDTGVGLATASATGPALGDVSTNGLVVFTGGNVWRNGAATGSNVGGPIGSGTVGIAYDAGANRAWVRLGTGAWAPGDPATTAGFDLAGLPALYPVVVVTSGQSGVGFTANFGASAFANAAPSGFSAWDSAASGGTGTGSTGTGSTGSGSTSTSGTVATISQVQVASVAGYQSNGTDYNATVTFANTPTPGNLLLFLCAGWSSVWVPPAGSANVGGVLLGGSGSGIYTRIVNPSFLSNSGTDNQIQVYARPVLAGDGKSYAVEALQGDACNVVALELSGAGSVVVEACPLPVGLASFTAGLPPVMAELPGEQVWTVFESDGLPGSVALSAGYTKQFTLLPAGQSHHQAVFWKRDASPDPGSVEVPSVTVAGGQSGPNVAAVVRIKPKLIVSPAAAPTLAQLPASVQAVPVPFVLPGKPAAGQVYNIPIVIPLLLPANLAGTATCDGTHTTADAVFTINKISGASAATAATVTIRPPSGAGQDITQRSTQDAVNFAAGDILQLVAPAPADATLADIGITLLMQRV